MNFKLIFITVMIACSLCFLTHCGDTKVINNVEYDTYGLINQDDRKNPNIQYKPIWGNIVWGSILAGTVIAPIYFFGFSMFEPVGILPPAGKRIKGAIQHTELYTEPY